MHDEIYSFILTCIGFFFLTFGQNFGQYSTKMEK